MLTQWKLFSRQSILYRFRTTDRNLANDKNAKRPILFIHGGRDALVPVTMQKELFDACPTKKEILTVENAVHAQSYYTDPRAYEAAVEKFISECETLK